MQKFFGHLNSFSNLITAVATAVLAVLTGNLLLENRRLRKSGSSPEIVVYLMPHPDGNGGVHFVLANVGRGPAFQVSFEIEYDETDFKDHRALLGNDPAREPISVLPQDEKIRILFGIGFELFGKVGRGEIGPLRPFKVLLKYFDIHGAKIDRTQQIDIRQFSGLKGILSKSNERKSAESLEKIEKHLSEISKQSSRFSAFVDVTDMSDAYVQRTKGDSDR